MSTPAKVLLGFCVFGTCAAAFFWLRNPTANAPTLTTSSHRDQGSKDNVSKLVPQPAGTGVVSDHMLKSVKDDFEFVVNSAKKALDGDGSAALAIANVLVRCIPIKYEFRDKPDPQGAFENQLAGQNLPQWAIENRRAKFLSCKGFLNGNPFDGLPDRPGGYESMRFWTDLAYRENDPVALVQHAAAGSGIITGGADSSKIEAAQADINNGAITGNPEALFRIGFLLADGRVGQDPLNGFAAMIAACNLGYDCTTNNEFAFGACAAANACQQGEVYTDKIRNTIGDTDYAQAFSRAQQLQDALLRGDTSAVLQFVQLKGARSSTSR